MRSPQYPSLFFFIYLYFLLNFLHQFIVFLQMHKSHHNLCGAHTSFLVHPTCDRDHPSFPGNLSLVPKKAYLSLSWLGEQDAIGVCIPPRTMLVASIRRPRRDPMMVGISSPSSSFPHVCSSASSLSLPQATPRPPLLAPASCSLPSLAAGVRRASLLSVRPRAPTSSVALLRAPPGAGMEKGKRSRAELLFCGSARAKWLQRAHFAGLQLQSRCCFAHLGGLRLEPLVEPELELSQRGP
jgi:hypothetical protein